MGFLFAAPAFDNFVHVIIGGFIDRDYINLVSA
jgi:hypothetical protein